MNISLRQLKGFVLVAQLRSFTRAAEKLHITQAGLSSMMRDLERQLGCRLFDRTTRSVALTPQGQGLFHCAERAVDDIETTAAGLKLSTLAARRVLTVAVTTVFASAVLPAVCRAFAVRAPEVEVRILDVPSQDIPGLVEGGQADAGFGIFFKPAGAIRFQPLLEFGLVLVAPPDYLDARLAPTRRGRRTRLAWRDLPALDLIGLPSQTPVQAIIDAHLAAAGSEVASRRTCNSMHTIVAMVAAGFGAAILPSMIVPSCPTPQLEVLALTQPAIRLPFHQLTRKGREPAPSIAAFTATMAEVVSNFAGRAPGAKQWLRPDDGSSKPR